VTMNVIVNRPEARWLPSRHRFALVQLVAFARLRRGEPQIANAPDHLILPVDRDQSASEAYAVAFWVFVTVAAYLAAILPMPLPLAIIVATPLASIVLHLPIVLGGPALRLLLGDNDHVKIVSVGTMFLLTVWSFYVARSDSWARLVAWFFFAVLACNAIAAVILWLLRDEVQAEESRCAR
jgi:hypothetical protein